MYLYQGFQFDAINIHQLHPQNIYYEKKGWYHTYNPFPLSNKKINEVFFICRL